MLIIWKGKHMVDYKNERDTFNAEETHIDYNKDCLNGHYGCECCHCKKIFMMLVLLLLTFIAGIMVGSCGRRHYIDDYYNTLSYANRGTYTSPRRLPRGMQPVSPSITARRANKAYSAPQAGGFVMEVDEID